MTAEPALKLKSPYTKKRGRKTTAERRKRLALVEESEQAVHRPIGITDVHVKNMLAASQIIANRGGARSSKSYSIAQILLERFVTLPNRKIFIVRKTLPSLRVSTYRLMKDVAAEFGIWDRITEQKQEFNWLYGKSLIHFGSIDDPEKIRSTEWNDIWMEEATEFTYDDFVNLKLRMSATPWGVRNQMWLSFNPVDEYHWVKTKVIDGKEDCTEIHSMYKDNPFLSPDYIKTIEALIEQDMNYYRIFTLGEWGRLENMIYSNWDVVQEFVVGGEEIYGLDFGFTNPSVLTRCSIDGDDCYLDSPIYKAGLTNADLIAELDKAIPAERRKRYPIYADCAEPQRIEEINRAGFWCIAADKSVLDGIDMCKRFRLHVAAAAEEGIKEIRGYSYRTDKNGIPFEEPVKFNDHFCDSFRYALHTHCQKRFEGRPRIRSL